jgi:ABC-type Zn uptake system ZnuABC Zn-binding protein ZnuA
MRNQLAIPAAVLLAAGVAHAGKVKVVVTSSAYKSIADAVGGEHVEVEHLVKGYQDPHIVRPKPSLAVLLREADLFVATGMDLEMWAPALVDMSNNPEIRSGQKGYVSASAGIAIIEKPITVSRAEGDVHIYGNPHVHTSPLNGKVVAANIVTGLKKVDGEHAADYDANLEAFSDEVDRRTFGPELVDMLGGKVLTKLAVRGKLIDFLEKKEFKGKKLIEYLGGWMKKGLPLRGKRVVAYHKNWSYFSQIFGLEVVDYMEPKPGIPPSPGHVAAVIDKMKTQNIDVMLAANYFDVGKVRKVADKVGATAVVVPLSPEPGSKVETFLDQFDYWLDNLNAAFAGGA